MIPKKLFLTKGKGCHKNKLFSFELALREAGIEGCNLVKVSSIIPPGCQIISKEEGIKYLKDGAITYCVMAEEQINTDEFIAVAVGLSFPKEFNTRGYLFENHKRGRNVETCGKEAQEMAREMLISYLKTFEKRTEAKFDTIESNVCEIAKGRKGTWTTAVSVAIFL